MANAKRPKRRFGLILFFLVIALLAFLLYDSNTRLVTEEYELYYENLPESFDGFRIVQLSDLHTAQFGEENETLYQAVREANPDIIAVTGDMTDGAGQNGYVRRVMTELVEIAPVFYVTGNHEWAAGETDELFRVLEECGVTALRNEFVTLTGEDGASIVLAGIDDPNGPYDMKTPGELMREVRDARFDAFTVLLAHRNDETAVYDTLGADLILCGHAHGGLIRLPFTDGLIDTGRNWFPTYTSGVYELPSGTELLVSRGLGNGEKMFRFLNNPHIPVISLQTGNGEN